MKKWVFGAALALVLLLSQAAYAGQVTLDGLIYNVENGVATVIGFEENTDTLVYHGQVEGCETRYPYNELNESLSYQMPDYFKRIILADDVVYVPENFASRIRGVTEIVFSESVKRIDEWAFYHMPDLESVTFPDGLESIGDYAFNNCAKLTDIFIPKALTNIAYGAFGGCYALTRIEVDGENPVYQVLEGGLYTKGADQALALLFDQEGEHFETAKGTTRILNEAFSLKNAFKSLAVSEGVTAIDEGVFRYLYEIEALSLPASLTKLTLYEYDMPKLIKIDVARGNPVYETRDGLLYENGRLLFWPKKNRLHGDIPFEGDPQVPLYLRQNQHIETLSVAFGFTNVTQSAFYYCAALRRIALPLGIQTIEEMAFENCVSLAAITLPPTLQKICKYAFANCSSLQTLIIPEGVTEIENGAFTGCRALKSIAIPASVTSIGENAFYGCPQDMVIVGQKDSAAYYYAFANELYFATGGEAPYIISQAPLGIERAGVVNLKDATAKAPLLEKTSKNAKKIASFQNGTTVEILEMDKNYAKVRVAGYTGYMASGNLVETTELTHLMQVKWGRRMGGEFGAGFLVFDTPYEDGKGVFVTEDVSVLIMGTAGTWYFVYVNGRVGYVQTNALNAALYLPTPTEKLYAVVYNPDYHDRLHLRQEPSTKARSLGRYFGGTQVELLEYGSEWCHVRVDGKEGYMRTEYLKMLVKEQGQYALFGNG